MSEFFDEISLDYWLANQKRINSKSYTCYHNGYVYGDDMNCDYFAFVCSFGDTEIFISEDSPRKTYVKFVETVCKQSSEILNNYRTAPAEKNRVYTEEEVLLFSKEKKTSTRIANGEIIVHGKKYYVANNLKICEYFNAAANALTEAQRDSWYIRTFFKEKHRNAPPENFLFLSA